MSDFEKLIDEAIADVVNDFDIDEVSVNEYSTHLPAEFSRPIYVGTEVAGEYRLKRPIQ